MQVRLMLDQMCREFSLRSMVHVDLYTFFFWRVCGIKCKLLLEGILKKFAWQRHVCLCVGFDMLLVCSCDHCYSSFTQSENALPMEQLMETLQGFFPVKSTASVEALCDAALEQANRGTEEEPAIDVTRLFAEVRRDKMVMVARVSML